MQRVSENPFASKIVFSSGQLFLHSVVNQLDAMQFFPYACAFAYDE